MPATTSVEGFNKLKLNKYILKLLHTPLNVDVNKCGTEEELCLVFTASDEALNKIFFEEV